MDAAKEAGNERAALALQIFAYNVRKYIGSYAAAMNGVDVIVLTGGIGENNTDLRPEILGGLEFMGVKIDAEKAASREKNVDISTPDSRVRVMVVETDEELVIAMDTVEIVSKQ